MDHHHPQRRLGRGVLSAGHRRTLTPPRAGVVAAVLLAGMLARPVAARADDAVKQLPEVVVTATRTETQLEDATTSVSVIGSTEVTQRDQALVGEALRGTAGVDVTEFGAPGQTTFATIRGSNPDQVLVLLDGVEVNTPTVGQFDFAHLTADNLDRIEILRGGGGALYGSEAIAGVVNVLTQRGAGPFRLLAGAEGGSAGTHHEQLGIAGAHGPFSLSGTTSYLATDGFEPVNNDYRNVSTVWRGDLDVLPTGTLSTYLRYTEARTGLFNFDVFQHRVDPNAYARDNLFLIKTEWVHAPTDTLSYRTAISWVRDNSRYRGTQVDDGEAGELETVTSHTPSEQTKAEVQVNARWPECALSSVGVEYREQWAELDEFDPEEADSAMRTRPNRSIVGLYGQEQVQLLADTLRGVGGVRYDHYDRFGDQVAASGSGAYLIRATQTRLRVGYAQGFRAPTFDELFGPLGNPNLAAETSWEIDAGVTQDVFNGRLRVEPTYFYREVHDLIEEVTDELPPVAGVPEEQRAMNFSLTRMQGVELTARTQPASWLTLAANYTYLNFVTPTGTLVNRPRHRGAASAAAEWDDVFAGGDRATASTVIYLVGHRDSPNPFDAQEPFSPAPLSGYGRVDVALAYHFGGPLSGLAATATARNLFNRDYSESIGFPAPPAYFLAGLRYEFLPASLM